MTLDTWIENTISPVSLSVCLSVQWGIQGGAGVVHAPPLACLPSKILVTCANKNKQIIRVIRDVTYMH